MSHKIYFVIRTALHRRNDFIETNKSLTDEDGWHLGWEGEKIAKAVERIVDTIVR